MGLIRLIVVAVGLLVSLDAGAQVPKDAPVGATGRCKDGTFSTEASRVGACHGHQGVRDWYAVPVGAPSEPLPLVAAPAVIAPAAAVPSPVAVDAKATPAGGSAGMVWMNTSTKVYHCAGSRFYGKTKGGKYMAEADAKAMGGRADHGVACGR